MSLYSDLPPSTNDSGDNNTGGGWSVATKVAPKPVMTPRAVAAPASRAAPPKRSSVPAAQGTYVTTSLNDTAPAPVPYFAKVEDEYDPSKPNDYEDFCNERVQRLKDEEERRDRSRNAPSRGSGEKRLTYDKASRVVLLMNLVGPGEVDDELRDETQAECEKHGEVERCLVMELQGRNVPPEEAVRVFVKFMNVDSAMRALKDMDGRFFAGRTVRATFFPEDKFNNNDLGA